MHSTPASDVRLPPLIRVVPGSDVHFPILLRVGDGTEMIFTAVTSNALKVLEVTPGHLDPVGFDAVCSHRIVLSGQQR